MAYVINNKLKMYPTRVPKFRNNNKVAEILKIKNQDVFFRSGYEMFCWIILYVIKANIRMQHFSVNLGLDKILESCSTVEAIM